MPAGSLSGKVAVITGGASGIGLATAHRLVGQGARVVIGDIDAERASAVAAEMGDVVVGIGCDVRIEEEVDTLFQEAVNRFDRVDIAFANAGIGSFAPIADLDMADWARVIEVNLIGAVLTLKHAARKMDAGGSIVITASLNAVQPAYGMSAYCCSKAGLAMLAQVAALELGPLGIRVNAIGPGLVRTGLTEGMWLLPEIVDEFDENAPLDTSTTPDDVARLVCFLASDDASSITGTFQLIDRGAHTKRYPDLGARFAGS